MRADLGGALGIALCATGAAAQVDRVDTQGDMRVMIAEEIGDNVLRQQMYDRTNPLGYFTWPAPTAGVDRPDDRPRVVADCPNLPENYLRRRDVPHDLGRAERSLQVHIMMLYEFSAYSNALAEQDCTCGSLVGDMEQSIADATYLSTDLTPRKAGVQMTYTRWSHTYVYNDYQRMCGLDMEITLD